MTNQTFTFPDSFFDPEPAKNGIDTFYSFSPLAKPETFVPIGFAGAVTGFAAFSPVAAFGYWFGLCRKSADMMLEGVVPAAPKVLETSVAAVKTEKVAAISVEPAAENAEEFAARLPLEESGKPLGLAAPKGGKSDDLKMISGVGPKIEGILHELGIYHFDQIAQWTPAEVVWVDDHLKFSGRITREDWIAQAKALAKGGRKEYVKVFGKEPV